MNSSTELARDKLYARLIPRAYSITDSMMTRLGKYVAVKALTSDATQIYDRGLT